MKKYQHTSLTVIIPTCNAGDNWQNFVSALKKQNYEIQQIFIIDSGSVDNTVTLAEKNGFTIHKIEAADFDHAGTRKLALSLAMPSEVVLFLTQDAILEDENSISRLMECFNNPKIAAAYGRQLPHLNAGVIGEHARYYNYPEKSIIKSRSQLKTLGFKTIFISNSCAAYRRSVLQDVGSFPDRSIFGEDTYVAAKLILNDWDVAYCAEARVYHSHDYNFLTEFQRYFDIGVFHSEQNWLLSTFSKPEGEGIKFLRSELNYLWKKQPAMIISALLRTGLKYVGYKLGKYHRFIPLVLKLHLSMNKKYWMRK